MHADLGLPQNVEALAGALKTLETSALSGAGLQGDISQHAAQLWYMLADASSAAAPLAPSAAAPLAEAAANAADKYAPLPRQQDSEFEVYSKRQIPGLNLWGSGLANMGQA
jgi:hypothetical protein